jgi:hypothetical protein
LLSLNVYRGYRRPKPLGLRKRIRGNGAARALGNELAEANNQIARGKGKGLWPLSLICGDCGARGALALSQILVDERDRQAALADGGCDTLKPGTRRMSSAVTTTAT